MRSFFPLIFATVVLFILGTAELLLLRFFNPSWWHIRWVRRIGWGLPLAGAITVLLWGLGEYNQIEWLIAPAAGATATMFILLVALMLSLPFSGLLHLTRWTLDKLSSKKTAPAEESPHAGRRVFLKATAAAVPLVTVSMGLGGVTRAFGSVKVPRIDVPVRDLPPELNGLRIAQLSDLHLRHYVTLDDLQATIEELAPLNPDLVLVTGDVSDDLRLLPDALRMIDSLKPRLGSFACLGNHEYFRGITEVRRIFDASPIPLLVNAGQAVPVGDATLFIGGTDDPRHMGAKDLDFFRAAIDASLADAGSDDTVVLMSHRPDAFDYAARQKIALTLSGHTHGGQVGFDGRSLFEPLWPDRYLWGEYRKGDSLLYTTAGMGHWFPFRLGCPPEAPLVTLRRA